MTLLPCGNHRRTRSCRLPRAARPATDNAATRVSTHGKEERVALPRQPTLVHRALSRVDRCSALSNSDDNEHNESNIFNRHKGIRNPT